MGVVLPMLGNQSQTAQTASRLLGFLQPATVWFDLCLPTDSLYHFPTCGRQISHTLRLQQSWLSVQLLA